MRTIITAIVMLSVSFSFGQQKITREIQMQVTREVGEVLKKFKWEIEVNKEPMLDSLGVVTFWFQFATANEVAHKCEVMKAGLSLVAELYMQIFSKFPCVRALVIVSPIVDDGRHKTGKNFIMSYTFIAPGRAVYTCNDGPAWTAELPY